MDCNQVQIECLKYVLQLDAPQVSVLNPFVSTFIFKSCIKQYPVIDSNDSRKDKPKLVLYLHLGHTMSLLAQNKTQLKHLRLQIVSVKPSLSSRLHTLCLVLKLKAAKMRSY